MALATYSDLSTAIGGWMKNTGLTGSIPDFIALAEAEFNRVLRTPDMEARAMVTLTDGAGPLPADSLGVREVIHADAKLDHVLYSQIVEYDQSEGGDPRFWAVNDGDIHVYPLASGDVTVVYHQKIPALTASNTTNWLMTRAPDLYLFASLMQAEFYGWNDERLPLIKARVDEILDQITVDAVKRKYGATPLAPRLRHPPTLSSRIRA